MQRTKRITNIRYPSALFRFFVNVEVNPCISIPESIFIIAAAAAGHCTAAITAGASLMPDGIAGCQNQQNHNYSQYNCRN